jgi:hypothetical protein
MANIFTLANIEDFSEKISIDDLYERKKEQDLKNLELFNKLLHRVHVRIKTTSRQKRDEQFCWFVVPEMMIGVPRYDQGACIAYIINKLKENGFNVRYIQPNTLFISWVHWVPSYVRNELKNKTGIQINEYGEKINEDESQLVNKSHENYDSIVLNTSNSEIPSKPKKEYKPIQSYKPSGNLIYDSNFLQEQK